MPEQLVRPVQTRVVTRKGHDYIEFGVRVPRQAVEASALDPEGIATAVARSWASELRNELGLPAASGLSSAVNAVPRAASADAIQRSGKAIDVTQ